MLLVTIADGTCILHYNTCTKKSQYFPSRDVRTCVFPPELAWMLERERLPAAVKELKKAPTKFMAPYAINSYM